jgi:NTE family protein
MYGLVLEGGGGKGSYQVGACRALQELGKEVSAVAGTSVGALNGAMFVQNDIDKAYDLWYNLCPSNIFNLTGEELEAFSKIGAYQGINRQALNNVFKRARKIISDSGLDVQPLIRLVKGVLDEEKIRKSPIHFGIVTVDLTEKKAVEIYKEDIPEGRLVDYVIASASFPAFKPAVIDGKTYMDGGFYNNLPIDLVSRKGMRDIIVIRTFGIGLKKKIDTSGLNIINVEPYENLGPTLDFNPERARKNMQMGYFDVLKVFRKLKGRKYYIEPINDDGYFINYLAGMQDWKQAGLCELLGLENSSSKRMLFEHLVPRTADLLGLSGDYSYEDLAIGLMERVADSAGLDRFRIYTFREFLDAILENYVFFKDDFVKEIPAFLRNRDLISRLTRDRIIRSIANIVFGSLKETKD